MLSKQAYTQHGPCEVQVRMLQCLLYSACKFSRARTCGFGRCQCIGGDTVQSSCRHILVSMDFKTRRFNEQLGAAALLG